MSKFGLKITLCALALNIALFAVKLYVGISSGCLAVYCDGINNLADSLSCAIAVFGFAMAHKLSERQNLRTQSLISFVMGIVVALTGAYFAYQGLEKLMYPTLVSFYMNYAVLIFVTALVKLAMGFMFGYANRRHPSPVYRAMRLDSFMDCGVTLCALISFGLSERLNFALDGIISVAIGVFVAVSAVKTVITQTRFLIND